MIYRVKDWDVFFEGAKSKNYKNKSTCSMPCKHGLGFKFMIRDGGPEVFGAWCAMIQILSRHNVPRLGFCTHDGTKSGEPYSCLDLELMTDIKASVFKKMFEVASSQKVDWLKVIKVKDTTVPCEGTIIPRQVTLVSFNSDSDSNLDSDSNSMPEKSGRARKDYSDEFEAFWNLYKVGSKSHAYSAWKKQNPSSEEQMLITAVIPIYKAYCISIDRSFKDGQGWINGRFWETDWTHEALGTKPKNQLQLSSKSFEPPTIHKSAEEFWN